MVDEVNPPEFHDVVFWVDDVADAIVVYDDPQRITARQVVNLDYENAKKLHDRLGVYLENHQEGAGAFNVTLRGKFKR